MLLSLLPTQIHLLRQHIIHHLNLAVRQIIFAKEGQGQVQIREQVHSLPDTHLNAANTPHLHFLSF